MKEPHGLFAKQSLYNFYIYTLRDPLDRAVSAFLYEHPDNIVGESIYPKWKQDMIVKNETRYKELLTQYGGSEESLVSQYIKNTTISKMKEQKKFSIFRNNLDAYTCFHTLNDFAMLLKNIDNEDIPTSTLKHGWKNLVTKGYCKEFAKMVIKGYAPLNVMTHTSHYSLSDITWSIGIGLNQYQSKISSVGSELQNTTNATNTSKPNAIFQYEHGF